MDPSTQQLISAIFFALGGFVLGWYLTRRERAPGSEPQRTSSEQLEIDLNALVEEIQESSAGQQALWNDLRALFSRDVSPTAEEVRAHQQANRCYAQLLKAYRQQIERFDPDHRVIPHKLATEVAESEREAGELADSLRRMAAVPAANEVARLMKRLADLETTNQSLRGELNLARQQIAEQTRALEDAQQAAMRDHLTGLPNRRMLERKIAEAFAGLQTTQRRFCLLMLDLDHFKLLNDTYGHPAGDAVLRLAARLMEDCCRGSDFVARYGGEEFSIVATKADANGGKLLAERIRERIANASLRFDDAPLQFTCSIGVAEARMGQSADALIAAADRALYAAKSAGRNTVVMSGEEPPEAAGPPRAAKEPAGPAQPSTDALAER